MKRFHYLLSLAFFLLLSLVIVYPLFPPGYLLTLDTVINVKIPFPAITSSSFLYQGFLALLNMILPSFWIQKIILILIFWLSGFSMYRFVFKNLNLGLVSFFAGIYYAINPFVYERIMAGHWQLLLGYSIFPLVFAKVMVFYDQPNKRNCIELAILTTLLFSIAIHYLYIWGLFFFVYGLVYFLQNKGKIKEIVRYLIIFTLFTLIFNANWLLSTVLRVSDVSLFISQFTTDDLISFQSVPDKHFGLIPNLLSGYGFWPEIYNYFISPKQVIFFWPLFSLFIIGLSVFGLFSAFLEKEKSHFPLFISLFIVFLISLDFSGGIALESVRNITIFLYEKISLMRGLREPQKLVGVIMFCYSVFTSIGLFSLGQKIKSKWRYFLIAVTILIPFIYTPTVFGSFWGQLKPVFYPSSWIKINQILDEDKNDFLVLFFPWNQYLRLKFNNNLVISNPARYYFNKPILSSQNSEIQSLVFRDTRLESLHIEGLLNIQREGKNLLGEGVDDGVNWGQDLSVINIKYIILSKDSDWESYLFFEDAPDIKKLYETDDIILYQNLKWGIEEAIPPE